MTAEFEELIPQSLEKKIQERVYERLNIVQKKVETKIDGAQASLTTIIEINDYFFDLRLEREATRVSDDKRKSPSFTWKVNGMYKILREARRDTDVESEPFFSRANDYKLRVLMEPSGDLSRSGKNGYVSFYLVIMRQSKNQFYLLLSLKHRLRSSHCRNENSTPRFYGKYHTVQKVYLMPF